MQKTVTFLANQCKRDFDTDNYEFWFWVSIIDTSLIGTPREHPGEHKVKLIITDRLMVNWGLVGQKWDDVTEDMRKLAFQRIEEYITELLKNGVPLENQLPPLVMETKNSPVSCPYKLSNISYPKKTAFTVEIDAKVNPSLKSCLEDFAIYVQSEKRMTFWQSGGGSIHRWIPQPEKACKGFVAYISSRKVSPISCFRRNHFWRWKNRYSHHCTQRGKGGRRVENVWGWVLYGLCSRRNRATYTLHDEQEYKSRLSHSVRC